MTILAIRRESTGAIESERLAQPICTRHEFSTWLVSYGLSLTRDEISGSYAIIRHNIRTYRSAGVIEVVRGKQLAESTLQKLEACQDSSDHHSGWRYFIEKTEQKPGIDPVQATQRRQTELEARESKAMQDTKSSGIPGETE